MNDQELKNILLIDFVLKEDISIRAWNVLGKMKITIDEFLNLKEWQMYKLRNCGQKTVFELLDLQNNLLKENFHTFEKPVGFEFFNKNLSSRARYVLQNSKLSIVEFLNLLEVEIMSLPNSGKKTSSELILFQSELLKRDDLRKIIYQNDNSSKTDNHSDNLKKLKNLFTPNIFRYLDMHELDFRNPVNWDLTTASDDLGLHSKALFQLAEYKAIFYLENFFSINQTSNIIFRLQENELEELYLQHKDLPFVARLCGMEIRSASKTLRKYTNFIREYRSRTFESVIDEILFLLPEDKRNRDIAVKRFYPWGEVLQKIGDGYDITRERVRQIENKSLRNLLIKYKICESDLSNLNSIVDLILGEGIELSKKRLFIIIENLLPIKNTNGSFFIIAIISLIYQIGKSDPNNSIVHKVSYHKAAELIYRLSNVTNISIRQQSIIHDISIQTIRYIRRQYYNSGAVNAMLISEKYAFSLSDTHTILKQLGYRRIANNWYIKNEIDLHKRLPILNSVAKIFKASGQVPIQDVYLGIQKHAERLKFVIAPLPIILLVLEEYGCKVDTIDLLYVPKNISVQFNSVEKIFIELIKRIGSIVTYMELYEGIVVENGFSLPALSTAFLRTSPIVEKIDYKSRVSLYKLRGVKIDEIDCEKAISRQPVIDVDMNFSYTLNGFSIKVSATPWLVTSGVLSIQNHQINEGEWKVFLGENEMQDKAILNNSFMYGLSKYIAELGIVLGDRVIFNFDSLNSILSISKVIKDEYK